ncbi:MAG TPA: energy-coupling factor transporter transmembrane protein EcfT [Anaerolineae bacterium]|nr:energy-coupling factor transporter transmembrane protein EcfT [Anaerolineae bacterium]
MNTLMFLNLDTPIHRLNPLAKLFMLACLWTASFASSNLVVMLTVVLFSLIVWRLARIPLSGMKIMLGVVAIVGILMIVVQGFFYIAGRTVLFTVFGKPFMAEGAIFGLTLAVKVLSVATATPILTMTTPVSPLMATLATLRLPYKLIFVFGTAMRLTPLVQEVFEEIRDAQRLRGHNIKRMNLIKKATQGYFPIFIPLLLSLLRKTGDMDVAIESRAFGAPVKRTYLDDVRLKGPDLLAMAIAFAFSAGLLGLSIHMGWGAGLAGWGGPFGK